MIIDLPADQQVEALIQLFMSGQYHELEAQLHTLLNHFPDWLIGWKILSDTYMVQKKDAREVAYRALALNMQDPEEHCYYGLVLKAQNDLHGAAQAFEQAIRLKPDYVAAINNLGIIRKDLGDVQQGVACFARALQLDPSYASCFSNLLFCLSQDDTANDKTLWDMHCRFAEFYETPGKICWKNHTNLREPERILNIGFVSAAFREHSLSNFFEPVLSFLAQSAKLRLHAYTASAIEDGTTVRLKTHFKYWRTVDRLNDLDLADIIRQDQIDILVDLDGHTSGNRLTMFSLKPAPIQASWLGYLATTGLTAMDYYIGDTHLNPPGSLDKQFSEKLIRLPVNAPFLPEVTAPDVNALPALSNGYITFACFNRINKITHSTVFLWSVILRQIPTAKLLLIGELQSNNHRIIFDWFKEQDIGTDRFIMMPKSSLQDYMALHHRVDICLDTMPASGVTTTCHAAWMGVPTLCIAGDRMISRGAAAIMRHLGLEDFVVNNTESYIRQACYFANYLNLMSDARQQLRPRFKASLLAQPAQSASALESAFRMIWKHWCAGKQTQSIMINHCLR